MTFYALLLGLAAPAALYAQKKEIEVAPAEPPPGVTTRAGWLEALRDQKSATLGPQTLSKTEQLLNRFADAQFLDKLEGYTGGFRPVFGGQPTGSGFAAGIAWRPPRQLRRSYGAYVSSSLSTRLWQVYTAGVAWPELAGGKLAVNIDTGYRDSNSIFYFGPPEAQRFRNRSNFRLEETKFNGTVSWRPSQHVRLGALGGYLLYNTGHGQDRRFASVEEVYTPAQVPGLDRQTDYLRTGGEIEVDFRDFPAGPKRGGNYFARYSQLMDQQFDRFSFHQIDLRATQYFPFFNDKRVIVLNGASVLTKANGGNVTPFYVQPTLGGSDDLRGFSQYRFYGDNKAVINVEYRWEVFSGLDAALFVDGGQIFNNRRDSFDLTKFELSYGIGFRGNVRNVPVVRIDIGVSRESVRVWFKFDNFM